MMIYATIYAGMRKKTFLSICSANFGLYLFVSVLYHLGIVSTQRSCHTMMYLCHYIFFTLLSHFMFNIVNIVKESSDFLTCLLDVVVTYCASIVFMATLNKCEDVSLN